MRQPLLTSEERAPVLLAAAAFALLLGTYAAAMRLDGLRRVDAEVRLQRLTDDWRLLDRVDAVVSAALMPALATVAGVVVLAALAAGRRRAAAAAAATVLSAAVSAQALKWLLGAWDPLGGDALREAPGAFPSGHAATAMALGLALVVVAPPRARAAATVIGAVLPGAVATLILALNWHYASDVAGAFLLALACAALVTASGLDGSGRAGRGPARPGRTAAMSAVAALAILAGAAALTTALLSGGTPVAIARAHPEYVAACSVMCAVSVAGAVALQSVASCRRRPRPSAGLREPQGGAGC